jgi:hypothetical protein
MFKDEIVAKLNEEKMKKFPESKEIVNCIKIFKLTQPELFRFEFSGSNISYDEIVHLTENLPDNGKYIYLFFADDIKGLSEKYNEAKNKKTKGLFSKYNDENNPVNNCMYVGSSSIFRRRMAEHIGKASNSAQAIRFSEWLPQENKICCYYFKIDAKPNVLQCLENVLWRRFKPMLGRFGAR